MSKNGLMNICYLQDRGTYLISLELLLYHCQSHFVNFILVLSFLLSKWAVSENDTEGEQNKKEQ